MSSIKLLKNGTVISYVNSSQSLQILRNASVLIEGDHIKEIAEAPSAPENAEIIDVGGKIVSPGFVNTHVHLWSTAYRSIAADVSLTHYFDWLSQAGKTAQTAFTSDDIYISTLEGYLEGLNGGITSFVDHAHANWSPGVAERAFDGAVDGGARTWWCYDIRGGNRTFSIPEQWQMYSELAKKPRPTTLSLGLAYDGLAGSDEGESASIKLKVRDLNIEVITAHQLGGPWPASQTSPSDFVKQGVPKFDIPIIVSHAPHLSTEDMSAMRKHDIHISITPESEFHYGHGQATGHIISDQSSLGVDTNFTFSGDILSQARLWLQTVRDRKFQEFLNNTNLLPRNSPMGVEQGFLMATRQGGRALHRDDIGVLQVGAKADIVVFNGDSPNMLGWSDPVAAVMLHANVGDIEHVMVGGQWRKKNFRLVNMVHDWADVKTRFLESARRIQAQALPPPPTTENLWGFKGTGDVETVSTVAA